MRNKNTVPRILERLLDGSFRQETSMVVLRINDLDGGSNDLLILLVDGRNPAPVDIENIPFFIGFHI